MRRNRTITEIFFCDLRCDDASRCQRNCQKSNHHLETRSGNDCDCSRTKCLHGSWCLEIPHTCVHTPTVDLVLRQIYDVVFFSSSPCPPPHNAGHGFPPLLACPRCTCGLIRKSLWANCSSQCYANDLRLSPHRR